jgi:muramoyltetrapeptide carboxypeptidase LdcA involved in peptidoglycan recycling
MKAFDQTNYVEGRPPTMIKPNRLKPGDTIATVSLSWGGAGDETLIHRYKIGKARLEEVFGLNVVEMPHALKGTKFTYEHPEKRAEDFMAAFRNPNIKAIISNIGGDDAIRMLPYIDFDVIRNNPKIFMGYSDTTINHLMCHKAGLMSYYGPCVLMEFAENVEMHEYTVDSIIETLFETEPIGLVESSTNWTSERLEWESIENQSIRRTMTPEIHGHETLQGKGIAKGRLIGGCVEVLDWARGTILWPEMHHFDEAILFLETSEEKPTPDLLTWTLRTFVATGIIDKIAGIVVGKPLDEAYYEEYKAVYRSVIGFEAGRPDLPILYNLNFGHTSPLFILPYGAMAEINCEDSTFTILEPGVE